MTSGTVLAIGGGKGGVGKTTTAIALGACAAAAGRRTVVVDADLGMADLGTFLDVSDGATVHEVLAGRADLEAGLRSVPGGFDVLPGSVDLEDYAAADPAALSDLLEDLRSRYDVVVVDTGAGLSHDTVLPLGVADEVVLVTSAETTAVGNTAKTADLVATVGGEVRGVVVTLSTDADAEEVADRVGAPVLGAIPPDETVRAAADARAALPVFAPEAPSTLAYADVAAALFDVRVTDFDFGAEPAPVDEAAAEAADGAGGGTAAAEGAVPFADAPDAGSEGGVAVIDEAEPLAVGTPEGGAAAAADDGAADADADDGPEREPATGDGDDGGADRTGEGGATDGDPDDPDRADGDAEDQGGDDGGRSLLSRLTGGLFG
ncbi:MAG: MinD/ParA family protein [Halobacteriaceae archaeon]